MRVLSAPQQRTPVPHALGTPPHLDAQLPRLLTVLLLLEVLRVVRPLQPVAVLRPLAREAAA